jgi:Family of unknown function (DUF6221)
MTDIVEFLNARLDEREQAAMAATASGLDVREVWGIHDEAMRRHAALHGPAWVLADVAAKRQIIEALESSAESQALDADDRCYECGTKPLMMLRQLALPNADHPDYRKEWRPET